VSRLLRGRFALPALVVLVLAALGAAAWVSRPGASASGRPVPQRERVTAGTRICPVPAQSSQGTRIAAVANPSPDPAQPAGQGQGWAQLAALATPGPPLEQLAQPGRLWLYDGGHVGGKGSRSHSAAQAPVALQAGGAMARGLEAEETTYPPGGSGALSGVRCPEPGTDFWFTGPGQAAAGSIELYLINPDSQAASADVDIYTDSGPLQGSVDAGITVPAGGSLAQAVDKLTAGSRVLGLHVRTSVGRVVAAVQAGGPGTGSWLPATREPATAQVIPGLPAGGGGRRLYLADPGGTDANVKLQAVTPSGEYEPTGGDGIDVPSGSAISVDLPSLNGIPAALRVFANVPVAAGLMAGGAYGAAAGPIEEQAVAADNATGHGYSTAIVLSAPYGPARVGLAAATTAGPSGGSAMPANQVVAIPAGHSTSAKIPGPRGGGSAFAVVVTPLAGSGPVYAGRVLSTSGGGQTIMPLASAPSWVPLPGAASSLTALTP
jgi:hypothetical protein